MKLCELHAVAKKVIHIRGFLKSIADLELVSWKMIKFMNSEPKV